jgi:hypothetical protein
MSIGSDSDCTPERTVALKDKAVGKEKPWVCTQCGATGRRARADSGKRHKDQCLRKGEPFRLCFSVCQDTDAVIETDEGDGAPPKKRRRKQ